MPLITILNAGMVEVSQKGHRQDLAIDRGYARCMGDVISVLTEAAIEVEHIDTQAAEEAQAQALRRKSRSSTTPKSKGSRLSRALRSRSSSPREGTNKSLTISNDLEIFR